MSPERESLIRSLFDAAIAKYAGRDLRLLDDFSDDFSGYSGCGDALVRGGAAWREITRADFAEAPRLGVEVRDVVLQDLAETVVAATALARFRLPGDDPLLPHEVLRLSLVFRREAGGWKIVHSGFSVPYHLRDDGRVFPLDGLAARTRDLERLVEARTAALERANAALETLSNTDELTGIANRRAFDRVLGEAWRRAARAGSPLGLLMIDLDTFKRYNDRYGHLAGDRCLERVARILAGSVRRAGDLAARFGGEEFAVLLPDAGDEAAAEVAAAIQRKVWTLALAHHDAPSGMVTVSIGVAVETAFAGSPLDLVRRADAALYRAKREGRDRVVRDATAIPGAVE